MIKEKMEGGEDTFSPELPNEPPVVVLPTIEGAPPKVQTLGSTVPPVGNVEPVNPIRNATVEPATLVGATVEPLNVAIKPTVPTGEPATPKAADYSEEDAPSATDLANMASQATNASKTASGKWYENPLYLGGGAAVVVLLVVLYFHFK